MPASNLKNVKLEPDTIVLVLKRFFDLDFFEIASVTNEGGHIGYLGVIGSFDSCSTPPHISDAAKVWDACHKQTVFANVESLICTFMDCVLEQTEGADK